MIDPFDPNSWGCGIRDHEFRIYGDDNAQTWCVVDEIDYYYLIQWKWHINKPHPTRNGKKQYFVRSLSNGRRYLPKLYLHVVVLNRTGLIPPSELHTIGDHKDGDEWNCRRSNLYWATVSENNTNKYGKTFRQSCA